MSLKNSLDADDISYQFNDGCLPRYSDMNLNTNAISQFLEVAISFHLKELPEEFIGRGQGGLAFAKRSSRVENFKQII